MISFSTRVKGGFPRYPGRLSAKVRCQTLPKSNVPVTQGRLAGCGGTGQVRECEMAEGWEDKEVLRESASHDERDSRFRKGDKRRCCSAAARVANHHRK